MPIDGTSSDKNDSLVDMVFERNEDLKSVVCRVSVQGVKSHGSHFAGGLNFMKERKIVIIFQKENENTFTLLIIFIVKSLQKEQNSTNLLL